MLLMLFALVLSYDTRADNNGGEKVTVDCGVEQMTVQVNKMVIAGFRLNDLRLLDPDCQPTKAENITHVTITTPLTGCGTTVEHTSDHVIYKNAVKDGYARNAVIGRLQALEIPFECVYLNHVAASMVRMNIEQTEIIALTPEDGSGAFELSMSIFKSENYTEEYISFPIVVTLQQRLYFQVLVDTPDTRLGIIADTCYATPINSISKKEKHDLIIDGCPKDDTVTFHSGPLTSQRFSFEAFQFLTGQVEPYLYVHCEVELCNLTDYKPSCTKDCNTKVDNRLRRAASPDIYGLDRGPIVILRSYDDILEDETENEDETGNSREPQPSNVASWMLVVMGCVCLFCLGAVIHTIKESEQAKQVSE